MAEAFLGLGSNLGERAANLREALKRLAETPGIRVERVSSFYETSPVGVEAQPDFINAVARVETELPPHELLRAALDIEGAMGRVRGVRWGPRIIDIDVLLYDDLRICTPELILPHPRMTERAFVMVPLAEIAPGLVFPDGRRVEEIVTGLQAVRKVAREA